jgi:hypothetical protein
MLSLQVSKEQKVKTNRAVKSHHILEGMFPVHMQLPSALPERFIGSKFID